MTLHKRELSAFSYPDPKLGGFGPFFSGILLLSLALLLLGLSKFKERRMFYVVILLLLFSVLVNPECWWARYVPQFWLIPVLTASFLYLDHNGRILIKWSAAACILLIFLNAALVGVQSLQAQVKHTLTVRHELKELSKMETPIKVCFGEFRANRIRFDEAHISYTEVNDDGHVYSWPMLYSTLTRVLKQ
jgi:hypothetical protein